MSSAGLFPGMKKSGPAMSVSVTGEATPVCPQPPRLACSSSGEFLFHCSSHPPASFSPEAFLWHYRISLSLKQGQPTSAG